MYYNAEQKQKFLDSCEGSKQILSTSLQLVAPYESQLDVDCSEFTREQILNFYENNRNELHAINSYKFVAKTHRLAYGMKATFL